MEEINDNFQLFDCRWKDYEENGVIKTLEVWCVKALMALMALIEGYKMKDYAY